MIENQTCGRQVLNRLGAILTAADIEMLRLPRRNELRGLLLKRAATKIRKLSNFELFGEEFAADAYSVTVRLPHWPLFIKLLNTILFPALKQHSLTPAEFKDRVFISLNEIADSIEEEGRRQALGIGL